MGFRRGGIYGAAAVEAGSCSGNTSNVSSPSTISIAGASATSSTVSCPFQQNNNSNHRSHYDTRNALSQQDAGSFRCEEEDCLYLCSSIVGDGSSSSSSATYYRSFHALLQLVKWLYTKGKRSSCTTKSLSLESSVGILFRSYRIRKSLLEVLSTKASITSTKQPSSAPLFTVTLATFFALLTNIIQKISSSKPSNTITTTATTTDTLVSFLDSPFISSSVNTNDYATTSDLQLLQETYSTLSRLASLLLIREYPTSNTKAAPELGPSERSKYYQNKTTEKKKREGNRSDDTSALTITTQPHSSPSSTHSIGSDPTRLGRFRRGKRRTFVNHDRTTTTTTTTDAPLSCTIPSLPENNEVTHNVESSFPLSKSITTCTHGNSNQDNKGEEEGCRNNYTTVENYPNKPCNGIVLRRRQRRKHHHQRHSSKDSFSFLVDTTDGKKKDSLSDMEHTTKTLFYDNIVPIILDLWNQQLCTDNDNENCLSLPVPVDYFPNYLTTNDQYLQVQQHQKEEDIDILKKPTTVFENIVGYVTLKSMELMCIRNNANTLHCCNEGENNGDLNGFQNQNNDLCQYLVRQSGCLMDHVTLAIQTCLDLTRHILVSLPYGKLYTDTDHCQHCSTKDTPTYVVSSPSSTFAFTEQVVICPFCLSLLQKRLDSILCLIDCSVLSPQNRSAATSTMSSCIRSRLGEETLTKTTSLVHSLLGLVKFCHYYMVKHCCDIADTHPKINLDDTHDMNKDCEKLWVQNIIRSCLSVLTSLGHENYQVGEDILASMTVTSADQPNLPISPTGYDLILDLLHYYAGEFPIRGYAVSKDGVSNKKEKIPSYDTCIFCLNVLTNTIETMGTKAKSRILNYSLQEDRHAPRTELLRHCWHDPFAVEGRTKCGTFEKKNSFLRWLTSWIGKLILVAFQSSTSVDYNSKKATTYIEGRRRRKISTHVDEEEEKKEDDVLSQNEVECLVLAGNGCILLTWMMKGTDMEQNHSENQSNKSPDNLCSTNLNGDICCIVVSELTKVVLQGIESNNETSENAIDVVVKTLKAFLNYYLYSVGESSIVVVDPILKLLSDLEAMKETKWMQELCKI